MKKLQILLLSIVSISIAVMLLIPLHTTIEELTAGESSISNIENDGYEVSSSLATRYYRYNEVLTENIFINDLFNDDNIYLYVKSVDYDFSCTEFNNGGASNSAYIYISYTDNTSTLRNRVIIFKQLINYDLVEKDLTTCSINYARDLDFSINTYDFLNALVIQEGFSNINDLYNDINFAYTVKFGYSLIFIDSSAPAILHDNLFYTLDITEPQISGTTATILQIIPFIIIAGIVVSAVLLIKRED